MHMHYKHGYKQCGPFLAFFTIFSEREHKRGQI